MQVYELILCLWQGLYAVEFTTCIWPLSYTQWALLCENETLKGMLLIIMRAAKLKTYVCIEMHLIKYEFAKTLTCCLYNATNDFAIEQLDHCEACVAHQWTPRLHIAVARCGYPTFIGTSMPSAGTCRCWRLHFLHLHWCVLAWHRQQRHLKFWIEEHDLLVYIWHASTACKR